MTRRRCLKRATLVELGILVLTAGGLGLCSAATPLSRAVWPELAVQVAALSGEVDPWGNPWRTVTGYHDQENLNVYSAGPNGDPEGLEGDDVIPHYGYYGVGALAVYRGAPYEGELSTNSLFHCEEERRRWRSRSLNYETGDASDPLGAPDMDDVCLCPEPPPFPIRAGHLILVRWTWRAAVLGVVVWLLLARRTVRASRKSLPIELALSFLLTILPAAILLWLMPLLAASGALAGIGLEKSPGLLLSGELALWTTGCLASYLLVLAWRVNRKQVLLPKQVLPPKQV